MKTQERRDKNYDARMDWWNSDGRPVIQEGIGCVVQFAIIMGVLIVLGLIGLIFNL